MTGLISDPFLALKAGAILTMIVCAVLIMKGQMVQRASYKKTEVYILLDRRIEVTPEVAQRLIISVLRDTYNRYAFFAACLATVFWIGALLFWVLRPGPSLI